MKEPWITAKEAAAIMTAKSGHKVADAYVRVLGRIGKLEFQQIDGRTKLYSRKDVEKYVVSPRGDGSVRRLVRAPRPRKAAETV